MSKDSKQVVMLFMLMQVNDPDENMSWYQLREWAGLEIVDDDEAEKRILKDEEDKEVEQIFKQTRQCHEQMLRGMCFERVKRNKNTCTGCVLVNVKGVESTLYRM